MIPGQKSPNSPQNARAAAAVARAANLAMLSGAAKNAGTGGMGGIMGGRGLWPLMMTQGNDMMQNYFLFRMLSGSGQNTGTNTGSTMGGLEPLIYGSIFGGLDMMGL